MTDERVVVVDGSNLATEGRTTPSLQQLDEAVRAYAAEDPDAEIVVVVDASFEHRVDAAERAALEEAELHGEVVSPPAGAIGRGDAFVLRIAERTGASVLSNDSFQEFHAEHPWLFDEGRLIGGKPVPGVGWIFTPRIPVRGPKSRQATSRARRAAANEPLSPPVKAAELAKAARKVAAKRMAVMPDGSPPRVGDVWQDRGPGGQPVLPSAPGSGDEDAAVAEGTRPAGEAMARSREAAVERAVEEAAEELAAEAAPAREKKAAGKRAAKKAPAEKAAAKKAPAEKAAAKKAPAEKAAAKKAPAKKAPAEKAAAKKALAKQQAATQQPAGAAKKALAKQQAATQQPAGAAKRAAAAGTRAKKAKAGTKKAGTTKAGDRKGAATNAEAGETGAGAPPAEGLDSAGAAPPAPPGTSRRGNRASRPREDPALREAIDEATAEALAPPPDDATTTTEADTADTAGAGGGNGRGAASGRDRGGRRRRRRTATSPPAVNEPLAFITFVAAHPIGSELEGDVVSFTSHGAMVDVDLPDGGILHCYIPLSAMADPPPTKARQVLSRGERRVFVLVGLDPQRRLAELALPGVAAASPEPAGTGA